MGAADISVGNLEQDYLGANSNVLLLQEHARLVMMQEPLNLPGDAGLAFQVKMFQSQFKAKALYSQNQFKPMYINIVASASNFCALFKAYVSIVEPLIKQGADSHQTASSLTANLSEYAGDLNQMATIAAKNLGVVNTSLSQLQSKFDDALSSAIKDLGESAIAASAEIDGLETEIKKNIGDIVEGADKVGGAVRELGIGILTQFAQVTGSSKAKPAAGGDSEEDSEEEDSAEEKDPAGSGPTAVPSTEFVVSAITAARDGGTETFQARADLESNNQKLAAAYQTLAKTNSLVATAKVIQVQNRMFAAEMVATQAKILNIANSWGQSPVIPPGSGISLGFDQYGQQISAIAAPADTAQLMAVLRNAVIGWNSFQDQLTTIKQELTGV